MNNEYRHSLLNTLDGLRAEHQKGIPGAVYEALHVSLDYSQIYDHAMIEEEETQMVEVPTWLVKAAIQIVGNDLKKQSTGTGKNAKWLTRLEQEGTDFFRAITVSSIKHELQCNKTNAMQVFAKHQNITPDAVRKSIIRSENSSNIAYYDGGFYQYVCNLSRE